eukprot:PhF_6_TR5533/c0_g1_i1/m.7861
MDNTTLSSIGANRINIPAICRIPGCGTAFLVAPGLLMTSNRVVTSKAHAAKLQAVFFESSKRTPVTVDLRPGQCFFSATYPEHLDYCLVACDTAHIYGVRPVRLPMSHAEWTDVLDKDVALIVQHPTASSAEEKRFEEVEKIRGDIMTFKVADPSVNVAGCPVFNDQGHLIGLFYQGTTDDGNVAKACHISSIVKHMFALVQLARIQHNYTFDELWRTWGGKDVDALRLVRMVQNFPDVSSVAHSLKKLSEYILNATNVSAVAEEAVGAGAIPVMIDNLGKPSLDGDVAVSLLQSLWNLSVNYTSQSLFRTADVNTIVGVMQRLTNVPEAVQYGTVLLFNVVQTYSKSSGVGTADEVEKVLRLIIETIVRGMELYPSVEVVLKFGIGCLSEIAKVGFPNHVRIIVESGGVRYAVQAMERYPNNEYLNEYSVTLVSYVARGGDRALIAHPSTRASVVPIITALQKHVTNKVVQTQGNEALWHLGVDVENRSKIVSAGGLDVIRSSMRYVVDM